MEHRLVKMQEGVFVAMQVQEGGYTLEPGIYHTGRVDDGPYFQIVKPSTERAVQDGTLTGMLVADMRAFIAKRDKFRALQFPHKRGYLLHGAPGCGKTSLLRLLSEEFAKLGGVVLFVRDGYIRHHYEAARIHTKADSPILFIYEDVDNVSHQTSSEESLIDFLDGAQGLDNVLFVGTTNYLEKVPPRLRNRPSRIDRLVEIKLPNLKTRLAYMQLLGCDSANATKLAAIADGMSFAAMKELFIATHILEHDVADVVARLKDMSTPPEEGITTAKIRKAVKALAATETPMTMPDVGVYVAKRGL